MLRFVPPAPLDTDGDGIPDSIECSPDVAGSFCDVDGNGHVGQLLTNGTGAPVTFADLPAPSRVRVTAGGTTGQASIRVCGFVTVQVQAGSEFNVSCGSVTIEVLSGTAVVVTLDDGDGVTTVTIPPGVKAKISNLVNDRFTVDYISGDQPVTVVVDGITTLIDGDTTRSSSTQMCRQRSRHSPRRRRRWRWMPSRFQVDPSPTPVSTTPIRAR